MDKRTVCFLEAATGYVLQKKVFLKFLQDFIGKDLFWSLLLIKLQACNFIKQRLQHSCFPV